MQIRSRDLRQLAKHDDKYQPVSRASATEFPLITRSGQASKRLLLLSLCTGLMVNTAINRFADNRN